MPVGLAGLVGVIRKSEATSDYYIHGFSNLKGPALKYAIVAAIASHPCDSLLLALLEDDRLAA
eukprot:10523560-Lingulodinium_polyedra.AAC.1